MKTLANPSPRPDAPFTSAQDLSLGSPVPTADEIWLAALRAAGRSPHTIASYRQAIGSLREWRGTIEVSDRTRAEAYAFTQWLGERYTPGGVAIRLRSLRAFYGWLVKEQLIVKNPLSGIAISTPRQAHLTPGDDQIEAMLLSAKRNRRDSALLTLLVDTGARKGEIAALRCGDIDVASGMVRFPVSKSMARTVPLSERSIAALGKWLRERGGAPGSLWAVANPYALVRQVVSRHSNGQLTPHSLRRSFAVRALRRGVTPISLMRLCGWSSHQMLAVYSQAHADTIAAEEYLAKMT